MKAAELRELSTEELLSLIHICGDTMPGPFVPSGRLCPRHGRRGVPPCQQVVQRDQNLSLIHI